MLKEIVDKTWNFTKRHYKKAVLPLVFVACSKSRGPVYMAKEDPVTVNSKEYNNPLQIWDID
ncbi:hypothetical protein K9L67_02150 [Candidatus Woesearchaeota archaeon]|nr:hypothetical protein [Candidatus Woesearchaeota archaeon]MCF7901006.1 hypothetical protein [Candidatus Woesearchaeota archaeon]MCF8013278.1 hypothetical protein [Candidatus Woesearchaeota archaeon]